MQFAHSGSEPEKQPPPHPALPYDVTAGAPHSAESASSPWRSAAFAPSTTPASPHSAALAPFHTIAPVPLHDAGYASSHHTAPVPFRNAAPVSLHGAVSISTHGAVPAPHHAAKPHAAHSTAPGPSRPPLGTAPELPEVWKQKSDQNCNFFAIGNCRRCPNHGSSPENEAKRPPSASFPLYGRRERAANRKKVAKAPGFLFS